MRIIFAADVAVDRKGYALQTLQEPAPKGGTLMSLAVPERGDMGQCICEMSGERSARRYVAGEGTSLWKAAAKVENEKQALNFFKNYGPILPGAIFSDGSRRQYWVVKDLLEAFKALRTVSSRREDTLTNPSEGGFDDVSAYLNNKQMANAADVFLDKSGAQGITRVQLKASYHLILIEMMHEIGVTRRTVESQRQCEHCGTIFTAGGGRGGSKRLDARYCSAACAKAASRLRAKKAVTCTDG